MHTATGLIHSYTLECNYNCGKILNHVPPAANHQGRASPERLPVSPPKYVPEDWAEVGRGVLCSLLDLFDLNPWSRVGNSKYRGVERVRHAVFTDIRNQKEYQV
jgi:cytosolic carboxypeptidase protein 5